MKKKFLLLILFIGIFLRLYRLEDLMLFIGDQGWFYLQARDLLLTGNIPLVGITSSHVWLHQGPFWTYILSFLMGIFGFNPVVGSYFTVFVGIVTIWTVYYLGSKMFSENIGLIASFLYATSPLIVVHSRMSYHTSLIPFFSIILLYVYYRWVNGEHKVFPLIVLLLAILYNFELATFIFAPLVIATFIYGLLKKREWANKILSKRILVLSLFSFVLPMLPILVYDVQNGYNQTVKFGAWAFYRIAVFLGYPPLNPNAPAETWQTFIPYALDLLKKLIFAEGLFVTITIFILSIYLLVKLSRQEIKSKRKSYATLLLFVLVPILGYIAAKTNSEAYTLIVFPSVIMSIAILFEYVRAKVTPAILLVLIIMGVINSYTLLSKDYLMGEYGYLIPYSERKQAAQEIVEKSDGKNYNLIGVGEGSKYESFLSNYEYLTWWIGNSPSKKDIDLKIYVTEKVDEVIVEINK